MASTTPEDDWRRPRDHWYLHRMHDRLDRRTSSEKLIPFDDLAAMLGGSSNLSDLADALEVDERVVLDRLDTLDTAEIVALSAWEYRPEGAQRS